jgi:hypothetical protein
LSIRSSIPQPHSVFACIFFAARIDKEVCIARLALLLAITAAILISGCAERGQPHYSRSRQRVILPSTGEVALHAEPVSTIDGVLLAKMSVTNLTERQRALRPSGIVAITDKGERVNELELNDSALANNGQALFEAIGGSAVIAGGENQGFFTAGDWFAMMLIAPAGEFVLMAGIASYYNEPYPVRFEHFQIEVHHLKFTRTQGVLTAGDEVTGYFFLPNRSYKALELSLENVLSGNEEVMTIPWSVTSTTEQSPVPTQPPE